MIQTPTALRLRHQTLVFDRPVIMGILNVTPDSFSDGGLYAETDTAVARARQMLADGADIVDVGGESTRPGSQRVGADEQIRRVVPVIQRLCRGGRPPVVSIDTTLARVAQAAVDAGAVMINDVSAGRDDPAMWELAARSGSALVLVHMRGQPATMQNSPSYADVVGEVKAFLADRASAAMAAGMPRGHILIDPGIGFGKTTAHNLALLAGLDRLVAGGLPVVLGTSRKRFLGEICRSQAGQAPPPAQLAAATSATTALAVASGVRVYRVHDVPTNRQAADVAWAITRARRTQAADTPY